MTHSNHSDYIDALKGLAIIAVTFIHTGGSHLPGIWGRIGMAGARGVQLFLLISAMLAFTSLQHAFPDRSEMNKRDVGKWLLRRYCRLFPMYYLAMAIAMLTGTWSVYWLGTEGHVTIQNLVMHIFFLHGLVPHYANSVIGGEWYLGVLAMFYILVPILYRFVNSLSKSVLLLVAVHFVAPWINSVITAGIVVENDAAVYEGYISNFGFFNQLPVCCMGIVLYYAIEYIGRVDIVHSKLQAYILLFIAMFMLYRQISGLRTLPGMSAFEKYAVWFGILIVSQYIHSCPLINNWFLRLCGKYSYGIYLFNIIWNELYARYLHSSTGVNEIVIEFVVSLAVLILASILFTNYIDQPIQNRLSKLVDTI